jgi:hypothetical protein
MFPYGVVMTHISENILSLLKGFSDYDGNIDFVSEHFLQFFVRESLSTYRIYSKLKNQHTDYKSVHKRVRKLINHGFIKKVENDAFESKGSVHGAIFYELSELGVYHVIHKTMGILAEHETPLELFKILLKNYKNNILFHVILYPYLNVETILKMYHSNIQFYAIWKYVRACCEAVLDALRTIKIAQGGGTPIYLWNHIHPGQKCQFKDVENKFAALKEYLESRYHLEWLIDSEVTKFEDDKTLKISHRGNSVIIELSKDGRKATLKLNRKVVQALNVSLSHSNDKNSSVFMISVPVEEHATIFLEEAIKQRASELVFAVTSRPWTGNSKILLRNDNKFRSLIKQTKNEFNKRCEEILVELAN